MDKRHKIILVSILIVVSLIAIMDIMFLKSGMFGSPEDYTNGNYLAGLWPMFFKLSLSIMIIFSGLYYFYYRKDISETIAIFLGSYALWSYFGISDVLYFWFQGKAVPDSLPWLSHNIALQPVANILGYTTITNTSLYVSGVIGIITIFYMTKLLKERF